MNPTTLTLPIAANRVGVLFERMMMMQELVRLALDSLPSSTDSDVPSALLNGLRDMLVNDCAKAFELSEAMQVMLTMNDADGRAEK
jgi:hypothetical protein